MGPETVQGWRLAVGVVVALLAAAGCGDNGHPLGSDDVTGLPPGNGVGSTFSGQYLPSSVALDSCYCRAGGCAAFTFTPQTAPSTVVQRDGLLMMTDARGVMGNGGIDADGTFSVGSVEEQPGAVVYAITDGKFALVNGQPDSVDCLATFTAIIKMPGVYFDCDFSVASTMRYQGP